MDDSSMSLRYELTMAELTLQQLRRPWFRRFATGLCLVVAVSGIGNEPRWMSWMYLALAVEAGFSFPVLSVLVRWVDHLRPSKRFSVQVDTDDKGLQVKYGAQEKASPIRYWWSRLSGVRQDRIGVMLLFDKGWVGLSIPHRAFPTADGLEQFVETVNRRLRPKPNANGHQDDVSNGAV